MKFVKKCTHCVIFVVVAAGKYATVEEKVIFVFLMEKLLSRPNECLDTYEH